MSEYRFLSWISGWPSWIYWNEQWFAEKTHWTWHLGFEDPRRHSHVLHQNTPALILSTILCKALLEVCWYPPLPSLRYLYPCPLLRSCSPLPLISLFPCSVPLIFVLICPLVLSSMKTGTLVQLQYYQSLKLWSVCRIIDFCYLWM